MIYEVNEKQQRIKYIRVLEKFFTRTISLLKLDNFDKDLFKQRTKKNYEELVKTKAVELHSEYYEGLQNFINKTMIYLEEHSNTFQEERATLLKDANLLQKEKNKSNYKKDKHKNQKFNDYINSLRINYVINEMVTNSSSDFFRYSMDGIAQHSGFVHGIAFSRAFQKHTGIKPSVFIKELSERQHLKSA